MAKRKRSLIENHKLYESAKLRLVGGVDSPVRSFKQVGGEPILIKRGKGSKVYDHDGNAYIDYVLSWGAMILGHRHPGVLKAVKEALDDGFGFGATNKSEIELAGIINRAIPFIEKVRFVNSGTEAAMGAVRLARGYTGRDKIVKFANAYHGHADYLLSKSGSGLATFGIPSSPGVPKDFTKHTIIAALGDIRAVENIFKRDGRNIAAVLVEPVGGNFGVLPPDPVFLKKLRALTAGYGSLLVFDEVITGFRFNFGSAAQGLGVIPDLIVLGKIIGGGFPVGAYGGSSKIMDNLAPLGRVYQASTFAGNPIVMNAGVATLNLLKISSGYYKKTEDLTRYLASEIEEEAKSRGMVLKITYYGNIFSIKFADAVRFKKFYHLMLEKGIYLAPSEFEANFLSFSHTGRDVEKTADAATWALRRV